MPLFRFFAGIIVLLTLCSSAAATTEQPAPPIIDHGSRNSKNIALTFDACPTTLANEYDDRVINVLLRDHVPATLFMSGRWVEKNIEKTKFLAAHPQFEIADHSYFHPHMMEKTDARDGREFRRTQALLKRVTGRVPRYFRPPFGTADQRIARLAAKAGLVTIEYDIASGDPDPNLSAKRIERVILRDARGGSIIVFHMNRHGVHTAEVLPPVIAGLRKKGYKLVTVGEMLKEDEAVAGRNATGVQSKRRMKHEEGRGR